MTSLAQQSTTEEVRSDMKDGFQEDIEPLAKDLQGDQKAVAITEPEDDSGLQSLRQ